MSDLTAGMETAIAADRALLFGALEINFPAYDLRLLDGSAEIVMDGNKFTGRDDTFGTIGAIKLPKDGVGDQAPTISLTLLPPTSTAAASLGSAAMQGSRVRIWLGVLDRTTGIPVPDPLLLFDGEIDVPTLKWSVRRREVEYRVVSVFDKFFDLEEGIRLSDSSHQTYFPGELGLAFVTGVAEPVFWGMDRPSAVVRKKH
jgi:hypothetical protein